MSDKILDFYTAACNAVGLVADNDGLVSSVRPDTGKQKPHKVDGKRLILPTKEFLRSKDQDNYQAFHPLSENLARGQSPVLQCLQQRVRANVVYYLIEIARLYMSVAVNADYQNGLPASWSDFLKETNEADAKTEKAFARVLTAATEAVNRLSSIYLRNGGKLGDKEYLRTCKVRFRIYEEIQTGKPYGIKLREKDVTVMLAVLKAILPGIAEENYYSSGTNAGVAPYFTVLMVSYGHIATDFNKAIQMAKLLDPDVKPIPLSYLPMIGKASIYYRQIPTLAGNEGKIIDGLEDEGDEDSVATPTAESKPPFDNAKKISAPKAAQSDVKLPARVPQKSEPAKEKPAAGVNWQDALRRQQQSWQQQQYQLPQVQQNNGLPANDWRSVLGKNPQQLQYEQQMMQQQMAYQQQQQAYAQQQAQMQPWQMQQGQPMNQWQQQSGWQQPGMQQGFQQPMQQQWQQPQGFNQGMGWPQGFNQQRGF